MHVSRRMFLTLSLYVSITASLCAMTLSGAFADDAGKNKVVAVPQEDGTDDGDGQDDSDEDTRGTDEGTETPADGPTQGHNTRNCVECGMG